MAAVVQCQGGQEALHAKVTVKLGLKRRVGLPGGPSMEGLPRRGSCVDKTPRCEITKANSGNHKQVSAIGVWVKPCKIAKAFRELAGARSWPRHLNSFRQGRGVVRCVFQKESLSLEVENGLEGTKTEEGGQLKRL